MQNAPNDKRTLYAGEARARPPPLRGEPTRTPPAFTGGLEESVTEDILRAAFAPFGELTDVNLPLDSSTRARAGRPLRALLRPRRANARANDTVGTEQSVSPRLQKSIRASRFCNTIRGTTQRMRSTT